ncbi:MAG: hypothetical protein VZS44_02375 [Bacilli bacterium]|nr:hypothetical protein [Bacilli bacterium]
MEKAYTFKQIIFGLRKEYLEIEKQLNDLKKYVNVSYNKIDYYIFQIIGNPSRLYLSLNRKQNLLDKIEILLGSYIHDLTMFNITSGAENSYYIGKKEICTINNLDELNKKIKEIEETEFFKNITANIYGTIPCNENKFNGLLINQNEISLLNQNLDYPHLDYYPREDILIMEKKEKAIIPDDIFEILNLSIKRSNLNKYHHKILDNYKEKEIEIEDNFKSNKAKLEIREEPKKLILKQKKTV